jgi:hypothetical protein
MNRELGVAALRTVNSQSSPDTEENAKEKTLCGVKLGQPAEGT